MADEKKVEETKADKFKRLANSRVPKALAAIANIRGIANKANYEYTPEQTAKIMGALEAEMTKLGEAFKSGAAPVAEGFSI
jgi:hypothetical protein